MFSISRISSSLVCIQGIPHDQLEATVAAINTKEFKNMKQMKTL